MQQGKGFEIPTWNDIYELLLNLARRIKSDSFEHDVIVGVSRGGWIPARVLSDLTENPSIASVRAEFYLGVAETREEPRITQPVSADIGDMKVLVVDDVSDTGESLRVVKAHLLSEGVQTMKVVTLYYKPWSVTIPDYYERTTRDWIIFPWERKEGLRKVIEKFQGQGRTIEEAKQTLIRCGYDPKLAVQFVKEVMEDSHGN